MVTNRWSVLGCTGAGLGNQFAVPAGLALDRVTATPCGLAIGLLALSCPVCLELRQAARSGESTLLAPVTDE